MKVCQVLASDGDGGLEKHTIELSKSLKDNGIDITVIAHNKFKDDFKDIKFIEMDLTGSRRSLFILWKLYQVLKKENFDIVHTQANKATDMMVKLKPFLKVKVIATLHGLKKNLKSFLKVNAVITVSDRIGEKLSIDDKVTVYNGIETLDSIEIDLHKKFNIPKEKFIICSVGRLVEVKGFDLLIESMQYVDQNIYLLLIGDGKDKEKLENLAEKLKIKNRIIFVGNVENKLTQNIIKLSDLLVISSRKEGFSYVFAESLRLYTPIVSTDVADIKKFITDKYIAPFDSKLLAEKINDFQMHYKQNNAEYQDIFNRAKNTFTLENMTEQTIKVYHKVMN